ncbi:MAG: penicillin-binding protein [Chitinophagales bacterium]|nr:penicillin-binding protein [Chitinophagales bacterium]
MAEKASLSFRKYLLAFWGIIIAIFLFIFLIFFMVSKGIFGELPSFEELENPKSSLATEVFSSDNVLLGKYYSQNRSNISYNNLPDNLKHALIATEDRRYYRHAGIDFLALPRVVFGVLTGTHRGGGSTITQQLAKNLFPRPPTNKFQLIMRKFKEWVIAVKLERSYTKEEIMTMYLNVVEFSNNAFGIKSAARTYFNKEVDSLLIQESAVLVGMVKGPTWYNPKRNPENSKARRNVVFLQMYKYGAYIDEATKDSLQQLPIELDMSIASHNQGLAPYFREHLRAYMKQWCQKNTKPDGTNYNVYTDGLKVYTTLDSRMQSHAEEAVKQHLGEFQKVFFDHWNNRDPWNDYRSEFERAYKNSQRYKNLAAKGLSRDSIDAIMNTKREMTVFSWEGEIDTIMSPYDSIKYHRMFLQSGLLSMTTDGRVKAWVGGINYKYFQYDHVMAERQIGSTFKPFVYATAIREKGLSPCYKIPNEKVTFDKNDPRWPMPEDWTPKNSDDVYGGFHTLKSGLANSVNTITAHLMHEISPEVVVKFVNNMGIDDVPALPSICLGTPEISVYEMVGAYGTFANHGFYTQPQFIDRIEDKKGNVLAQFTPVSKEALDEQTSYIMVELLKNVVNAGTARRLRFKYGLSNEMAGKTGTTQNHSDGWFIGFTPDLVTGVWVGGEDRFIRFRTIRHGQGASMALPIFAHYTAKVFEDEDLPYDSNKRFKKYTFESNIELDCENPKDDEYEAEPEYGSEFDIGASFDD